MRKLLFIGACVALSLSACKKDEQQRPAAQTTVNTQPNLHSDVIRFTFQGGPGEYTAEYAKFVATSESWVPSFHCHSGWYLDIPIQAWDCYQGSGICIEGYSFDVGTQPVDNNPVTMFIIYHQDTIFSHTGTGLTGIMDVGVPFGKCY